MCRVLRVSARRLLRLAGEAAEQPGGRARGPGRRDQGHPRRGQGPLRQPADPRRAGRPGRALLREHRGQADAPSTGSPPRRGGSSAARPTRTTTARWPRTSLDRRFEPEAPNRAWTADITYIPTGEGWLYLAAVEDLYSRRIVGWSMGARIDSRLVVDALEMAVARRLPGEGLVAHSDRGSQYASEHYQRLLAGHGITCSMSRRANCWDNAPMESFFASLKKELTHDEDFATREEARASLFEYIEVFYNRIRRHSSLGYKSPAEYL